jgi:membrane-bound metal-dependent hydrolase YbcI (DUF457 family)
VLPDLDLLWLFTVGQRRQVHHAYLPHLPLACAAFFAAAALLLWMARARRETWLGWAVAAVNVMLHLVLDTTAGGIRWLWPFSDAELVSGRRGPGVHPADASPLPQSQPAPLSSCGLQRLRHKAAG